MADGGDYATKEEAFAWASVEAAREGVAVEVHEEGCLLGPEDRCTCVPRVYRPEPKR